MEASGEHIYSLNSKTYLLLEGETQKMSCKGVSKKSVIDPEAVFKVVLQTRESIYSNNRGIKLQNTSLYTYNQDRQGFNYFYVKREVLAHGISIKPISMPLYPRDIRDIYTFSNYKDVFSLNYACNIRMYDILFPTLEYLFYYEIGKS